MSGSRMNDQVLSALGRVALVLVEPKYPENIGAAARVAKNMGIRRLLVVTKEFPDRERMVKMATHNAADIIDTLRHHRDLASALEPFSFVVGTTARQGRQRRSLYSPRAVVGQILPLLKNNQVALLFGPEHRGLTNQDLNFCNLLCTIPTQDFSSLNLAQAVGILTYELATGLRILCEGADRKTWAPKQATSFELEGMYDHLEQVLRSIGYLHDAEGGDGYWMRSVRQFLGRVGLRSKEVKNIRGFCRRFLWYEEQKKK